MIATGSGLHQWDLSKEQLYKVHSRSPLEREGLTVNAVYSMTVDSRGNLWVGLFNGVVKANFEADRFKVYQNVVGSDDLRNYALTTDDDGGLGLMTTAMRGVTYRPSIDAPPREIWGGVLERGEYNGVKNIYTDKKGVAWFSSKRKGIHYHNLKTGLYGTHLTPATGDGMVYGYVTGDLHHPNIVWLLGNEGLLRFDQNSLTSKFYPGEEINGFSKDSRKILVEDDDQNIWFLASGGAIRFDKTSETFTLYSFDGLDSDIDKDLLTMKYRDDELWIAGKNSMSKYIRDQDQFVHFTPRDDLLSNGISSFEIDEHGNLWIGQNGITRYDHNLENPQSFDYSYKAEELINRKSGQLGDGTIVFPTGGGILAFHPDDMIVDTVPPVVVISSISINNKTYDGPEAHEFISHLTLTPDDRVVSFSYAALKYRNNQKIKFRIRLTGFDKDWQEVGNKREAIYTNLNPGEYTFEVMAANADGVWVEHPAIMRLTVLPPFYQTTWFYTLIALMTLTVLYAVFKYYQYTQDLSRQKQVAEQSAQYKSLFLANMSHEIRTPMNAILGMSKLIVETPLSTKQQEYTEIIRDSAENLLVIINDILDQSKIESGKYSIVNKPFELDILIRQLANIFEHKAKEKGLLFTVDIAPDIPNHLNGDATRLNQILMNLINNAVKFTETGSVMLSIQLAKEGDTNAQLQFEIRDTGPGIPHEKKTQIFESFERINAPESNYKSGTGLGLAIAKQLINLQGGKIWVDSMVGHGSSFFFTLFYDVVEAATIEEVQHQTNTITSDELSFLIVEDTYFNQRLAVELIKKHFANAVIEVANNGQICLEKLKEQNFDLILMDVKMPVMDGLQATRIIRNMSDPQKALIPILGVTANAIQEQLDECMSAGMNDYITKPIDSKELYQKITINLSAQTTMI